MSHEYLIDAATRIAVRVTAESLEDALARVREIDAVDPSTLPPGVVLSELSLADDLLDVTVAERDGEYISGFEAPVECSSCGEVYDETSGDGYCGLCPTCADKGAATD